MKSNRNSKKVPSRKSAPSRVANKRPNVAPSSHSNKKRRRRAAPLSAALPIAIGVLALLLLALRLFAGPAANMPVASELLTRSDGDSGLAVLPDGGPVITLVPQTTAAPTPTPTPFEYLPVAHRAKLEAKKIAVTVDDCYQVNNLKTIVDTAQKNGAKLTLFPVGENIQKADMPELLKRSAFDLGFEIENHTWSHARIFRLPDDEMAAEIWKQDAALDRALGVHYQEHFLRLMGGDGDTDPRIHSYLKQLGYLGFANWSVSGSDSDMKHIKNALAPGQVYLFHCTDPDTEKLKKFIPWAVSQGYQLVTLNELFSLPSNETSPLAESAMPEPEYGVDDRHTLKEGEYTWVALQLQEKLRSLGYLVMDGPSTGYYGPQTAAAVAAWQKDHGLSATGEADYETQQRLLEG